MTKYCLYHGTSKANAYAIVSEQQFNYIEKDMHFLGQGVYFYDKVSFAERWARATVKTKDKGVLSATISVEIGDVLDLRKRADFDKILVFYYDIIAKVKVFVQKDNKYHYRLRCYLYDMICEEFKCKMLIARISADKMVFDLGICDSSYGDLQYCVKDSNIISNINVVKTIPYVERRFI